MERRRAGEEEGRKLSAGERAKNWASAAVTLWPVLAALLGLVGYTSQDEISTLILAQPDGVTEIQPSTFQQQTQQFSTETVQKLKDLQLSLDRIERQIKADKRKLQAQINEHRKLHE